ncbi:MAG: hypothetical protein AVDCRST_MAG88-3752, partial [uncultured Thermomicrobiales bacterium]
ARGQRGVCEAPRRRSRDSAVVPTPHDGPNNHIIERRFSSVASGV